MKKIEKKLSYIGENINKIIDKALSLESRYRSNLEEVHPRFGKSARNLVHYLALRTFDLDRIQSRITDSGLIGFGRIENHVMSGLDSIRKITSFLNEDTEGRKSLKGITAVKGRKILKKNTRVLFGRKPEKRNTRIMVTIPSSASEDYEFIKDLIRTGMNCARINCAHDNADIWKKMIDNIKKAETELGRKCTVMMDLAGPKIRTGVIKSPRGEGKSYQTGNESSGDSDMDLENDLVLPGSSLKPPRDFIRLSEGDSLRIMREAVPGRDASLDKEGNVLSPACVSCTLPEILDHVKQGDAVFFDDGKIEGVIESTDSEGAVVGITSVKGSSAKLRQDKGINFPTTGYVFSGFTGKDSQDIAFIAEHADAVNLSFVNRPSDVEALIEELEKRDSETGIILKIETREGFCSLPELLLTAMKRYPVGVMIARGDLAVEAGWKSFAAVQEEIIRTCAAAHIPVIWATQVLENLAKKGIPTRSEITDAAMGHRCECVMLNKGPYILKAVKMLDRILRRMENFQNKQDILLPGISECEDLRLSERVFE